MWLILFVFAGALLGNDVRSQFDRTKAQARAAVEADDLASAEARYEKLLELAAVVRPGLIEMYAEVISPLAEIYKKRGAVDKLEKLYQDRLERSAAGLERGLAQADLGFFYQASDFASADQLHGEQLVAEAVKSFEQCAAGRTEGEQCRRRLGDTAGLQGAVFFQKFDYQRAEPLFRRVIGLPESTVQDEVMLVSLHALRGILVERKDFEEAKLLELRAAAFESSHPEALNRLKQEGSRSRSH